MKIKEITNKKLWENFISLNSPQSLFQSWNWGEVVKKYQISNIKHQKLWRFGICQKNDLIGIAQIEKVVAKRGTFLHVRHGPIFSLWNRDILGCFCEHLRSLAKEQKADFIRISPLIDNSDINRSLVETFHFRNAPIHAMDGEYCWVLDLDKSEEELLLNMRKTTRYLIRQAQKLNITVTKSQNLKDIDDFWTLYDETARRHHFIKHQGIKEEFEQFLKDDQILLFKGYYQGRLLSAAFIIFYNHQAIYHHSASVEQKIPVNYLLQWEVIKEAKKRGMKIYNFWGVAPEGKSKHPWQGHSLFKKGFGGRLVEYIHAKDLQLSFSYYKTYVIEYLRKLKRGY